MTHPDSARSRIRRWVASLVVALALVAGVTPAALAGSTPAATPIYVDPAVTTASGEDVRVIVQAFPGALATAQAAVEALGGTVTKPLPIVEGFAATVPGSAAASLATLAGARVVSLDAPVTVQGASSDGRAEAEHVRSVRADGARKAGVTGKGVTVALIDTGIAEVPDLAGRILPVYDDVKRTWSPCVNLTREDCGDSYGHGTFIAGIIAGNGASSGGERTGIAPEANLVSVKIAGRDGSADVSAVLAAIQWVVSFRDRYGIRVLNLSLGTDSTQTYRTDPLNYAVERAWASGITVVVSAGNRGPQAGTISKPADDPWVISVGAVDDRGTPGIGDEQLPNFSSRGPTAADGLAKPDVVAPGAHVVSLRAVGSAIDTNFPNYIDGAYRKGSGTSMAAAVVSGAVALLTQNDPGATPDRIKFALMSTARGVASSNPMDVGRGEIDALAALSAPPGTANQGLDRSNGLGSLDASRGNVRVRTQGVFGLVVSGMLTGQLVVWNPVAYATGTWDGSAWYGSAWYGSAWYGSAWYGSAWYGSAWYGSAWYGTPDGSAWYGSAWYGSAWYGAWE